MTSTKRCVNPNPTRQRGTPRIILGIPRKSQPDASARDTAHHPRYPSLTRRGCEFFSRTNSERVSCLLFLVFCRIRFDWASVCFVASCFSTYDRALPVIHFVHAHPLRTPSFFILMKLNVIAYHKLDVSALIRPRTRNW